MGFQSWDRLAKKEERELGFEMRAVREGLGLHDRNFSHERRESLRWKNIEREDRRIGSLWLLLVLGLRVWVVFLCLVSQKAFCSWKKSSVFFRNIMKKRKRKSVWLCGLNVKSILSFDVLVVWGVDSLDLFRFNFVLMWTLC